MDFIAAAQAEVESYSEYLIRILVSVFVGVGRDADDAGAAYVAQWYVRNVYIFSNVLSLIVPGDRVVLMMGQGHEYLQREFVRLNPNLVVVDPLKYLSP